MEPMTAARFCSHFMTLDSSVGTIDPLLDLELRVARRADELARIQVENTALNLHCWLCAEQEIMGDGRRASGPEAAHP